MRAADCEQAISDFERGRGASVFGPKKTPPNQRGYKVEVQKGENPTPPF